MGLMDILRKSEKLVFWNRCRLHSGKADFRDMVLNGYHSPDFLELHHYGDEYQGRIVYNAGETGNGIGFFAELGMTLIKLHYADDRGLVPYIHWGENYVYYEPEGICGEKNAFLHYFKPASEVMSIANASYVLNHETWHCSQVKALYGAVSYDVSQDYIDAMARMLRKYIRYNDETEKYLKDEYGKLLGDKKTIAVHYRGTDFNKGYNNHPVPVQVEQEIEKVRELLNTKDYEQIFLATDENAVVERFKKEFGEAVKVYDDTYRDDGSGESIAFSKSDRKNHHYRLGLEVLRDQYTLTHCEGIVCGYSNITFIARVMRRAWFEREWEDYCLINNGLYHNKNSFSESENARRPG
ncbi:MAG: O-fucosyltransferase family protein [Lachnospiraceae bacterium]|nr:O-fucosyltransferase family protein [Lachnospiraceae bacterium]